MKHIKLITLLLFISFAVTAQQQTYNVDFFNNGSTPWNWTTTDGLNNPHQIRPNNNAMEFFGAKNNNGGAPTNFISASAPIGQSLCNTWVADFNFQPTEFANLAEPHAGAFIFAVATGGGNPYRTSAKAADHIDADMIALNLADLHPKADLHKDILKAYPHLHDKVLLVPYCKNGAVPFSPSANKSYLESGMFLDLGQKGSGATSPILDNNFSIKLERISSTWCRLSAYDLTLNEDKGSICFPIPEGIRNLNHIHFTNHPGASTTRALWGKVTDLTIQDCFSEVVCCTNQEIIGPDHVCLPGKFPLVYSVEASGDATYQWILPDGVDASNLNEPTLEIYGIENSEDFTIQLIITCGCIETVLTRTITVTPDVTPFANFSHYPLVTPTNNTTLFPSGKSVEYNVVQLVSTPPFPTTSLWELYHATSTGALVGAPIEAFTNPTLQFAFAPVDGGVNNYYRVVHTISVEGSGCPPGISSHGGSNERVAPPSGNGSSINNNVETLKNTKPLHDGLGANIYPNPSSGTINVAYKGENMINSKIILRDILGRTLSNQPITNEVTMFELKTAGIYTIEIWNGETLESTERVIIE